MNAGAVLSKLLQISAGWVYTRDGTTVALDAAPRLEALSAAIDNCTRKVLVFAPYKHALAGIGEYLATQGIDYAVMSGDTPVRERSEIFSDFQTTSRYKVLLAHPACLAHGVTLTEADTAIWFGPVTSLEIYQQACGRVRRIGQSHKQLVLHFQGTPAERKIYKLLAGHRDMQTGILDLLAELTREGN